MLAFRLRALQQPPELREYRAVVLGGARYMGRRHKDARAFLKRHADTLDERPLAVFAMGPQNTDEAALRGARQQLDRALRRARSVEPLDVAIFGGVIDPAELRFPFNCIPAGDARDWDAIRAWATDQPPSGRRP